MSIMHESAAEVLVSVAIDLATARGGRAVIPMALSWPAQKEGSRLHLRISMALASLELTQVAGRLAASLDADRLERSRATGHLAELDALRDTEAEPSRLSQALETPQQAYPDCAWIGFVDAGGTVRSSTDGVLEGQSVAQRTWFRSALRRRSSALCTMP
jgi:hypothetical protein